MTANFERTIQTVAIRLGIWFLC